MFNNVIVGVDEHPAAATRSPSPKNLTADNGEKTLAHVHPCETMPMHSSNPEVQAAPREHSLVLLGMARSFLRDRRLMQRPTLRQRICCAVAVAVLTMSTAVVAPGAAHAAGPPGARIQTRGLLRDNGANIAYREINSGTRGTPLLLIVGYGSTMAEWDPPLISDLAQDRRVIMFDNRGAGDSTGSVRHLSVRVMADDTAGVIRGLHLGHTDVLGWSMGGFVAQELALDHPGMVRRLILASTDPGSPHAAPGKPAVIHTLTNPATSVGQLLPILFPRGQTAAARTWLNEIASQPGLTSRDFAVSAVTKAAQTNATHKLWLGAHEGTYARLPAIRAHTLVAYATKDVIVPPANAQILLKRIPQATALRVCDAGHAFLFQDPASTAKAFTAFLSGG